MINILKYAGVLVLGLVIGWVVNSGSPLSAGQTHLSGLAVGEDGLTLEDGGDVVLSSGSTLTSAGQIQADAGILASSVLSTTTPGNVTMKESDLLGYTSILMYPSVGDVTATLPASSTLTSLIPNAGDVVDITFVNSTTTAGIDITLAGGTGLTLQQASSTLIVGPSQVAILRFIRLASTDILAFFSQAF